MQSATDARCSRSLYGRGERHKPDGHARMAMSATLFVTHYSVRQYQPLAVKNFMQSACLSPQASTHPSSVRCPAQGGTEISALRGIPTSRCRRGRPGSLIVGRVHCHCLPLVSWSGLPRWFRRLRCMQVAIMKPRGCPRASDGMLQDQRAALFALITSRPAGFATLLFMGIVIR